MNLIDLLLEKKDGIATITLNAPDKLNAMSSKMRESLLLAMDDVNKDDSVKVVILTGAGRGFCAGADLTELAGAPKAAPTIYERLAGVPDRLSSNWKNRPSPPLTALVSAPVYRWR